MSSDFDFGVIYEAIPFLFSGMGITLLLTIVAIIGGIIIGTLLALMKLSPFFPPSEKCSGICQFFSFNAAYSCDFLVLFSSADVHRKSTGGANFRTHCFHHV